MIWLWLATRNDVKWSTGPRLGRLTIRTAIVLCTYDDQEPHAHR
jgi:hypothetical protein